MSAEDRRDSRWSAGIFFGLAVLFWLGRSRSFGPGDSPQHALSALLWGVPHPPGYPLEMMLGWLWSRLAWSNPSAAINGLSGIYAALCASLFFLSLRRLGCRPVAALTGTALMALSPLFWYYSLVAEARSLNNLLSVLALVLLLAWARSGKKHFFWASSFVLGLGLSHHPSYLFVVPSLFIFLSARVPKRKDFLIGASFALAGLVLPYFILGLRLSYSSPAYNPYFVEGWSDLPGLFLRKNYGGPARMVSGSGFLGFGRFSAAKLLEHAGWLASAVWTHAGPAGIALAALGAWDLARRDRRCLAAWACWLGIGAGVFVAVASQQMTVCDQEYARAVLARHYLLPLIALFALAAHGAEALARRARPGFMIALAGASLLLPLALRPLSLRGQDPLLDYARGLVRDSRPGDLVILAADDSIFAVFHLNLIEGEGRDRVFLTPSLFSYPAYLRALKRSRPDLVLPPLTQAGLSTDWDLWKRLNPGRAVLAEASLRDNVLRLYPHSVPQGTLIRIEEKAVKDDPAAAARRFLEAPETASWTRSQAREWTQETYVLRSRYQMAEWIGSRLDPKKDQELIVRFIALLKEL